MKKVSNVKFCYNCGASLVEGSQYCANCGCKVYNDTSSTESYAGNTEEEILAFYPETKKSNVKENTIAFDNSEEPDDSIKRASTVPAQKASGEAHDLVDKINQKPEDTKTASKENVEVRVKKQKLAIERKKKMMYSISESATSNNELWSWLKQSSKRQHFYTEQVSFITEDNYFKTVGAKLHENLVPAVIEKKKFQWDRSDLYKEDYIVTPLTNAVNPLSCLIQFIHIGKFTFVEEKTFITPPNLPAVPLKKKPVNENLTKLFTTFLFYGAIIFIAGLLLNSFTRTDFGAMLIMLGVILFVTACVLLSNNQSVLEYNRKCERMEKEWEEAWRNWQDRIFIHSFQEDTNGQVSRIYDSVFECIKQVNDELFNAKEVVEVSENISINELESCIARRKDEYR